MRIYSFLILTCLLSPFYVMGQGYYDDDIYYDASKEKGLKLTAPEVVITDNYVSIEETSDLEAPIYQVYTTTPRDIDEYNRKGGIYALSDSIPNDSITETADVFAYTERIERFENPDVIRYSSDERLKELYYADEVNIYVGVPSAYVSFGTFSPWYSSWYSPWHYSWHYYNPWSYNWGYPYGWYDPFWGMPYHWGYYPHYNNWGWHYPHYYWGGGHHHRYYADGGRRPFGGNRTSYSTTGGRKPMTTGRYDSRNMTGRRPSSSFRPTVRPNSQPASTSPARRPTTTYTNGYRGSSTVGRTPSVAPRDNNRVTTERNTPSYNNRSNQTTGRTPSYNNGSTNHRSSSGGGRGSFGGGGSRGGGRR